MSPVDRPASQGQPPDPPERRTKSSALRLSEAEATAVRVAIRKVAKARGSYTSLAVAVAIGIPTSSLYAAARPTGRPSPGLAIRLAAVAGARVKVPDRGPWYLLGQRLRRELHPVRG
jgi:hypothetical protein